MVAQGWKFWSKKTKKNWFRIGGHSTTKYIKFWPILTPQPLRVDKNGHFIYFLPSVTWPLVDFLLTPPFPLPSTHSLEWPLGPKIWWDGGGSGQIFAIKLRRHLWKVPSDTHKSITIVTKQPYFNFSFLVMRGTSSFLEVPAILLYSRLYSNKRGCFGYLEFKKLGWQIVREK